jgi:hypothetical protein
LLLFRVSRKIRRHAFICGCGHSGTTLIANILGTHSQIHVPKRETSIFMPPRRPLGIGSMKRYRLCVDEALAAEKLYLVEKTPRHVEHIDLIRANVPGAKFIIPVRDGRDVAASIMRRKLDLGMGIARWIHDNGLVAKEVDAEDVLIYRHEDLVRDPTAILQKICRFLGVPYEDTLLDYHKQPTHWHGVRAIEATDERTGVHHRQNRNWQVNQPIFDASGTWRDYATEEELRDITTGRGRPLMELFDYL